MKKLKDIVYIRDLRIIFKDYPRALELLKDYRPLTKLYCIDELIFTEMMIIMFFEHIEKQEEKLILCLESSENQTGKSTFIQFLKTI